MPHYAAFEDARIKHLEMIQSVIGRLGTDSFLVKGWSVTLVSALAGFSVTSGNLLLSLIGTLVTVVFWALDATYLHAERLFRELYERVRRLDSDVEPFYMSATNQEFVKNFKLSDSSLRNTMWSRTLKRFYLTLASSSVLVACVIGISQ